MQRRYYYETFRKKQTIFFCITLTNLYFGFLNYAVFHTYVLVILFDGTKYLVKCTFKFTFKFD